MARAGYARGDRSTGSAPGVTPVNTASRCVRAAMPTRSGGTLASIAAYLFTADHAALVTRYLEDGNPPDQPGRFVVWLYPREAVHGFRFDGAWLDIGDHAQLLEADNRMRRRAGLPETKKYSLLPAQT